MFQLNASSGFDPLEDRDGSEVSRIPLTLLPSLGFTLRAMNDREIEITYSLSTKTLRQPPLCSRPVTRVL